MNSKPIVLMACLLAYAGCGEAPPTPQQNTERFNIDETRITVSGVSAGAYMAGQYHLAYSSEVSGAGLIAGGPYWCASGSVSKGLGPCMNGGDIDLAGLLDYANTQASLGSIDQIENLAGDSVWIFLGMNDAVIHADVPAAAGAFYTGLSEAVNVTSVADVAAPHGMPTIGGDSPCDDVVTPFLNNCGYDAAGELLRSIADIASTRADTPEGELIAINQPGADEADMLNEALLFVPASCADGQSCGLHIAFHGCQQSTEFVDDAFASRSGYNEWASSNNLLVLYPQVASSRVAPMNPLGCWDWWGYTGEDYATRAGAQIVAVRALVDSLSGADR